MPMLGGDDVKIRIGTEADTKGIDQAESKLLSFSDKSIKASQALSLGILGAGAAIGGVGIKAIEMAGQFEQSQVAFTQLLGSSQKADMFLKDLFDFAAKTPFEFKGIQDASRKLLAFGFDAKQILPMMTSVGDAVSALGGGAFEIDRVTRALGQMKAKNKVSAEEMMQLAELGIPVWDMLAKKIGTDVPTAMDLASKGAISGMDGVNAILEGMNDRFSGGMAKQSETVLGLWSTMKDTLSQTMVQIGTKLIETFNIQDLLKGAIAALEGFKNFMLNSLIPFLEQNKGIFIGIGVILGTILIPAFIAWGLAAAAAAVGTFLALAPLQLIIIALAAVATLLYLAWNNNFLGIRDITANVVAWFNGVALPAIKKFMQDIELGIQSVIKWFGEKKTQAANAYTAISTGISQFVAAVAAKMSEWKNNFITAMEGIKGAWESIWGGIKGFVTGIWDSIVGYIKGKINSIIDMINGLISAYNSVSSKIGGDTSGSLGSIPKFADGVTNFSGGAAIVGEEGPELVTLPRGSNVIPNDQLGSVGGGVTINMNNTIYGNVDMEAALRSMAYQLQTA